MPADFHPILGLIAPAAFVTITGVALGPPSRPAPANGGQGSPANRASTIAGPGSDASPSQGHDGACRCGGEPQARRVGWLHAAVSLAAEAEFGWTSWRLGSLTGPPAPGC
jgi:hypothetical protein